MTKSMMRKGILLLFAASMMLLAAACNKKTEAGEDYREFVFKESSFFEISEADYGYFTQVIPYGEQIAAVYTETIYPDAEDGEAPVYDGTMEDSVEILPFAMGTPAVSATEGEETQEAVSEEDALEEIPEEEIPEDGYSEKEFYMDDMMDYPTNYYNIEHMVIFNQDGTIAQQVAMQLEEGESSVRICPDGNNSVIYMVTSAMDSEWNTTWFIKKFDMSGKEIGVAEIDMKDSEYAYVQSLLLAADNKIVIGMENTVGVYDADLKKLGEISSDNYMYSFFASPSGSVYATSDKELPNGNWVQVIFAFDLNQMEISNEYEMTSKGDYVDFYNGVGSYDAVARSASALYGWDAEANELKKIVGYVESDLDSNIYTDGFLLDDTTAVFCKRNVEYWALEGIRVCKKVEPSEIKEKEVLTMGMLYYDTTIAARVIEFNSKNDTVRIQIKNYRENDGDWEAAQKAFNNDLISGNCPDIVCLGETTEQFYNYMKKGTFAPLDSFIEKDAEIDVNDIFPNVKEALSDDGKMYAITPNFYIMSMAMKAKYAPENGRITFEELKALEQQIGTKAFYDTANEYVLNNLLTLGYDEYIDIRTGKCDFSDSFASALEYAAQYPTEIDYSEEMYADYESVFREDRALLNYAYIADFREFNRLEQGVFGEEIVLVGFPGTQGKGATLCLGEICAISSKSKNKEAAWEFVRELMTTEYQESINFNFPTRISVCEKQMAEQMQKPYYVDPDGVKHEYDDTYYIGGEEIVLDPISKERADYVMEYISGIESVNFTNEQISNIIREESAPFFAGQKNAKQVVEIIQSRVQTYVNESR